MGMNVLLETINPGPGQLLPVLNHITAYNSIKILQDTSTGCRMVVRFGTVVATVDVWLKRVCKSTGACEEC